MKRLSLLAGMLACMAVLVGTVWLASPKESPVRVCPENIEEIWAIEDARTESDAPLVTALDNGGVPLCYDAEENTFYCTLGLDCGEDWPALDLAVPDAGDVSLVFADDYSYDWCHDAVRDGCAYQLMAYTDEAYWYTQIVFTGLPQIALRTQEEIGLDDTPVSISFSTAAETAQAAAYAHLRGAGSLEASDKKSYKIDFGAPGETRQIDVPGVGPADDIILLAGVMDESLMRDRLSWDIYAMIAEEGESYGPRDMRYVELFIDNRYAGVYMMMEPVDDGEELSKRGMTAALSDSVYRTAQIAYAGEHPFVENAMRADSIYELYHAPSMEHAFAALEDWLALENMPEGEEHDEAFAQLAAQCVDVGSLMRYYLFVQAGGMGDNVFNNMYLLARRTEEGMHYAFAPWDMDLTWGRFKDEATGESYQGLFSFPVAERMIRLGVGGAREELARQWAAMRENAFTMENIRALIEGYMRELTDSGAYVRNSLRWRGDAYEANGEEILTFCDERLRVLDGMVAAYAQ